MKGFLYEEIGGKDFFKTDFLFVVTASTRYAELMKLPATVY